jgi:hypothetical protein
VCGDGITIACPGSSGNLGITGQRKSQIGEDAFVDASLICSVRIESDLRTNITRRFCGEVGAAAVAVKILRGGYDIGT